MKRTTGRAFVVGFIFALLACLVAIPSASAQSTTDGAIAGTVYDPSGAVLPNVKIVVKNNGTNEEQTTATDDSGYYRVGKLQPSNYTVKVEAPGFAPFRAEQVVVQIGSITELNAHLQVGSAAATVLVSYELPLINTSSPDFAPIVDQVQISNLPINGGRWSDFALLTPAVVNDGNGFGLLSIRGQSTLLNNNTVDGADNNQAFFSEERGRTRAGYSSAKAAVQEFQVNTSDYTAEYGRATGGVINTVTKSGTNQIHGEVYGYNRNDEWAATNPFTTLTEQTSPGVFQAFPIKPEDKRNIYGFGVGGPIIKGKLFFYFAFDRFDRNFPGVAIASNPKTFFATPSAASLNTLAGNLGITTAQAMTDYNTVLADLTTELGTVPRKGQQTIFFPKVDWEINPKNHATVEVNRLRWVSPAGIQTQTSVADGIASFGNDYVRDTWGIAKLYTSIKPTLSNEARFQYGRDFEFEFAQPPTPFEVANYVNPPGFTNPFGLSPDVFISNGFDMGVPTFLQRPAFPDERRTQGADTVTWSKGKHSIKFGFDIVHTDDLSQNLRFQFGSFSYSNLTNFVSDFISPNHCTVGAAVHSAACYSSFQQAFGPLGFEFTTNDYGFFVEDNWRLLPRLTVTLGLRYDYESLPSPFANLINPAIPQTGHLPSDTNNLGPRVGLAWDIRGDGKTSLRAGFGIYYGRIINSAISNALTNTGNPNGQLSFVFNPSATNPVPITFPQIFTATPTANASALAAVYFDPHFQAPKVYETDLSIEREIGWNTAVSLTYLGSFGHDLPDFVDTNISPSTKTLTYTVEAGPNVLKNTTVTVPLFTGPRPNPNFGAITNIFSGVDSNYNAVTAQITHRVANNVSFGANFTWSHALDTGENATTFTDTNDLQNPFDIGQEYGNSNFDIPERFVLNAVLTSPWHAKGWLNYLVSGWEAAPIYQAQSGLPYSLVTSGNAPGGLSSGLNGSNGRKGIPGLARNSFRMPRTQVVDLRVSKSFRITERFRIELLGEGFNLFNHVNATTVTNLGYFIDTSASLTDINGVPCSSSHPCLGPNAGFGHVSNANSNFAYSTRQVQLGARFFF
jgi:outer membrane receptor protein involved in Fe transport